MSRSEQILRAIAEALSFSRTQAILVGAGLVGLVALLVFAVILQRVLSRRRLRRASETRFENEIRRVNVTIRELDVLNLLGQHLNDPAKKYLLLTNPGTFHHCTRAAGKLPPEAATAHKSLAARLGYSDPASGTSDLASFKPARSTVVKVESPHKPARVLGTVTGSESRLLSVNLESGGGFDRGDEVLVYASHPSGIVCAEGEFQSGPQGTASIRLLRAFHEPDMRHLAEQPLKVFVRPEGERTEPAAADVHSIWPTGAALSNPGKRFRRGDDLQVVLRRNHAKWAVVNAEVVRLRRRRSVMRLRFSHLSSDARREILGRSEA